MEKDNQRVAITKRLLKEGLLRLLEKKKLDSISVTELCREAGINRGTFYRHYEIPKDLLLEMERDLLYNFIHSTLMPKSTEQVRPFVESICAYINQHANLFRVAFENNLDADFIKLLNDIIVLGIQQASKALNLTDKLDEEDIKLLAGYGAGGSYVVLRQWILGQIHKTADEVADFICNLLLNTDWNLIASQLGIPLLK